MKILGIETSCDETGVAIYDTEADEILSHKVYSQIKIHARYGGVVPELASRDHANKIIPLIEESIMEAGISKQNLDAIAYTKGPGLSGALLVGAATAQALSFTLNIPAVPINHLEGHLLAPMIEDPELNFPFLALLISGGHTQIIKVTQLNKYEIIGESIDDAIGEAFDKTGKILGLNYPAGAALSELARKGRKGAFVLPRPMTDKPCLNFSFSGLKTAAARIILKQPQEERTEQFKADIAAAFEDAATETLILKCAKAIKQTGYKKLVASGGVSANYKIRQNLEQLMLKNGGKAYYPRPEFCGDNGIMIAYALALKIKHNKINLANYATQDKIEVMPRWPLSTVI